jgi:hypothetical protein
MAAWAVLFSATCAAADSSTICQRTPKAKQDALLVLGSDYRPVTGNALQIGDVDFSVTREVNRKFLIVAPLRAQPTTGLGGIEMRSDLELLQKCAGKNVFALNFSFDGSTLTSGTFSQPLSVFQAEVGMKGSALSAPVETATGTVKRFWIKAELAFKKKSTADVVELRLTNDGNLKSTPLRFTSPAGAPNVHVDINECEARLLSPSESCVIEFNVAAPSSKDEAFEWPVDVGEQSLLTLQFERRRGSALSVNVRNR